MFLAISSVIPLLEKDSTEVGPMNLCVTHGAGLILRRLIVGGPGWSLRWEGMALQTEHVHRHHFKEPGIGRTVRRVATAAAFGLYWHMLINKGPLLVDVALVAHGITARQRPYLP
jgi:hypothetical protein